MAAKECNHFSFSIYSFPGQEFCFNFQLPWVEGPNKKSNVDNKDELEVQIMDKLVPLET